MIRRAVGATALAVGLVAPWGAARGDEPRVGATLEVGSELDTNPHREYGDGAAPAGVLRAAGRLDVAVRPAPRKAVTAHVVVAGKKFLGDEAAPDEDLAVVTGELRGELRAADAPLGLGLRMSYYDAIERDTDVARPEHDFRTGDGTLSLTLLGDDGRATLAAGVRAFAYKPDARYDFVGEHVDVTYATRWSFGGADDDGAESGDALDDEATLDFAVSAGVTRRGYDAPVVVNLCAQGVAPMTACLGLGADDRADLEPHASLQLTYTGALIIDARYQLASNRSNSFGQSYVRQRLEASATHELPFGIVGTLRLVLQLTQFVDPLLLSRDVGLLSIDDENRNMASLRLSRELGGGFTLETRAALYRNEFATEELGFARTTVYLGLVVRL